MINGSELLREWVDDPAALPADLDALTLPEETSWADERRSAAPLLADSQLGCIGSCKRAAPHRVQAR